MKLHPDITGEALEAAIRESMFGMTDGGFCNACGAEAMGVEPDAEKYRCESCGESEVYGAEVLAIMTGYLA